MQIHQVLVTASPGDASTNSALELRDLLRQVGPSEVFARYIHPEVADEVRRLDDYDRLRSSSHSANDLLLFHMSIGEPKVFSFISERPERLVLIYHNISPAAPFMPYDPAFAGLLEEGRRELAALRDRTVLAVADSQYNADELIALGYRDVRVARLIIDVDRLCAIEPDPEVTAWLDRIEGPVALFVGQLLPHKRPDLLLKAFHVLVTYHLPTAHLLLVGTNRLPGYSQALELFRQELNLGAASFRGALSMEAWAAHFRRADAFVTASEHEGFLVPLVESFAFGKPIVARAHAAIPETMGDAGLLLPPDEDPILMAEAMAEVLTNDVLRKDLVERGRDRLEVFDAERARAAILGLLLEVV
ncbi:MAG TPA: glycosyltransferase family 4 protein [Acidimicrobiales bacterium]|nr:glycosyltransferase family 4 protein [Acidimicrobiales bacterium]